MLIHINTKKNHIFQPDFLLDMIFIWSILSNIISYIVIWFSLSLNCTKYKWLLLLSNLRKFPSRILVYQMLYQILDDPKLFSICVVLVSWETAEEKMCRQRTREWLGSVMIERNHAQTFSFTHMIVVVNISNNIYVWKAFKYIRRSWLILYKTYDIIFNWFRKFSMCFHI